MKRIYPAALLLAIAMGVALRLAWCEERASRPPLHRGWRGLVAFDGPNHGFPWLHDEYLYYVSTAVNAFKNEGFVPDYNRVRDGVYVPPPLQSFFTLGIYRLHGRIVEPVVLQRWQVAFAALLVALSAEIGRRLGGPLAGGVAAWLVAISPAFCYWTAFLQTEANYLFGSALVLLLLLRWQARPLAVHAASASLALGLLNLQRVNALLLGPVFAGVALLRLGVRRGIASAAVFLFLPFLVLLPWLVRNLLRYDEPILVNSNAGVHLFVANNIGLDALRTPYLDDAIAQQPFPSEIERWYRNQQGHLRRKFTYYDYSERYMKLFRAYVREHPWHFLRNYAIKLVNQFVLIQDAPKESVGLFKLPGTYWLLDRAILFGGFAGLGVGLLRRRPEFMTVALPFALQALMGGLSILERDGRYNAHLKLFLVLFLAYGVAQAHWRATEPRGGPETLRQKP